MIEAVFLDAGGVLLVPRHDLVRDALSPFGVDLDAPALDRCHYAGVAAWDRSPTPESGVWPTYFRAYAGAAGVDEADLPLAVDRLGEAFRTPGCWSRALPGARDAVAAIAESGRRVVVVSNAEGTVEADLAEAGVCQVGTGRGVGVVRVIDSSVVGVAKPDPAIFRIALDAAEVDPSAAVHVGDAVVSDVAGARAAGIRALHLDPHGFCDRGDHEHLRELGDLLTVVDDATRRAGGGVGGTGRG